MQTDLSVRSLREITNDADGCESLIATLSLANESSSRGRASSESMICLPNLVLDGAAALQ